MRYRHSLRFRIIAGFVACGAVIGPLMALALLYLTYELEERMVEEQVEEHLQAVIAAPERFVLQHPSAAPELAVFTRLSVDQLPAAMFHLPDGLHEYEPRGGAWIIALATTPAGRYAAIEDITVLEEREQLGLIVVVVATLLSIYLALWLGVYFSRRLLAPLTRLAAQVAADDDRQPPQPFRPEFAADEVGALAAAIDRYRLRMGEALRREREFSADASHELRNPLAVIQNAAEIIEDDAATPERSRRAARRIHGAALRMSETVSTFLLMVREPEADPDHDPVAVAECVEAALQQQAALAHAARLQVRWQCEADPQVRAPRAAVASIVGNLIRNAVEHSGGRQVLVRLEAGRFVVADDGVGVSEQELSRLTEHGWRGRTAANGYGIGLSLVQRLCERFGWELVLTSRPGAGTRAEWRFTPGV